MNPVYSVFWYLDTHSSPRLAYPGGSTTKRKLVDGTVAGVQGQAFLNQMSGEPCGPMRDLLQHFVAYAYDVVLEWETSRYVFSVGA